MGLAFLVVTLHYTRPGAIARGNPGAMIAPEMSTFSVMVVAAGSGARAGGGVPKQFRRIGARALLRHTLGALMACPGLADIRVGIQMRHRALYEEAVEGLDLPPPFQGGRETRQETVFNGLQAFSHLLDTDKLLIHDAARPFVPPQDIAALVRALDEYPCATLCSNVTNSLRGPGGAILRDGLVETHTPQGFRYSLLRDAHARAMPGFTDDASLVEAVTGTPAHLVQGCAHNMKVTTEEDMSMALKLLSKPVSASGLDVHAFGGPGPLRLGGADIPYDRGLAGHSDADVLLHAVTDALLGLTASGDIGAHFPPSDPQWRGADSRIFVEKALDILRERGGHIMHLDCAIIAQAPKIGPYRGVIQESLATITGLPPASVSVKATTTEGLGFTGRGEGIAAQALVSAVLP